MLYTLAFLAAVTTAPTLPEIPLQEPVTRSARLLRALDQAQDDFASVQKELGLVGAAPLTGLKAEPLPAKVSAVRSAKPRVQKASIETRR
jgi:hypothetical protein